MSKEIDDLFDTPILDPVKPIVVTKNAIDAQAFTTQGRTLSSVVLDIGVGMVSARAFLHKGMIVHEFVFRLKEKFARYGRKVIWIAEQQVLAERQPPVTFEASFHSNDEVFLDIHMERAVRNIRTEFESYYGIK